MVRGRSIAARSRAWAALTCPAPTEVEQTTILGFGTVDDSLGFFAPQNRHQVFSRHGRHLGSGSQTGAGRVRSQNNVETMKSGVNLRLLLKNIEPGTRDLPGLQSLHQLLFVHYRSASRIDQKSRLLHEMKLLPSYQMVSGRAIRDVEGDEVRALE